MNSVVVARPNPFRVLLWMSWALVAWLIFSVVTGYLAVPLPHLIEILTILGVAAGGWIAAGLAGLYLLLVARTPVTLLQGFIAFGLGLGGSLWFWLSLPT